MTWVAHLVQTQTGRLGTELRIEESGSWEIPLGGIETFDVTTKRAYLRAVDPAWWFPIRGSVLVSWRMHDGRLSPWLLGPITNLPEENKDADTAKLECRGIGHLLEGRIMAGRDYAATGSSRVKIEEIEEMAHSYVEMTGMSYGAMMQEIVRLSTTERMGGQLPISFGTPAEYGSGLFDMTYYGYNIANNDAWKLITARANLLSGPDFSFRPRFTDDTQTHVEWELVHGTVAQRSIHQIWTMDLDTTSSKSPVSSIQPRNDSEHLNNRTWWTGAGEDAGTLIRVAQNDQSLSSGMPLVEKVGSTSDSDSPSLIQARADAGVEEGQVPLQQVTAVIDGSDTRAEIGRWHVGDKANVTIGTDWLALVPGTRPHKIIAAKGGWHQEVTLEFQEGYL